MPLDPLANSYPKGPRMTNQQGFLLFLLQSLSSLKTIQSLNDVDQYGCPREKADCVNADCVNHDLLYHIAHGFHKVQGTYQS